jgi:hypothetical protein
MNSKPVIPKLRRTSKYDKILISSFPGIRHPRLDMA